MKRFLIFLLMAIPFAVKAQYVPPTGGSPMLSMQGFYKVSGSDTTTWLRAANGLYFPVSSGGNFIRNGTSLQTANFNISGIGRIGDSLLVRGVTRSTGVIQSVANIARGTIIEDTLKASSNSALLIGLDINPGFNDNGHTSVRHMAVKASGSVSPGLDNAYTLGNIFVPGAVQYIWKNAYTYGVESPHNLTLKVDTGNIYLKGIPDTSAGYKAVVITADGRVQTAPYGGGGGSDSTLYKTDGTISDPLGRMVTISNSSILQFATPKLSGDSVYVGIDNTGFYAYRHSTNGGTTNLDDEIYAGIGNTALLSTDNTTGNNSTVTTASGDGTGAEMASQNAVNGNTSTISTFINGFSHSSNVIIEAFNGTLGASKQIGMNSGDVIGEEPGIYIINHVDSTGMHYSDAATVAKIGTDTLQIPYIGWVKRYGAGNYLPKVFPSNQIVSLHGHQLSVRDSTDNIDGLRVFSDGSVGIQVGYGQTALPYSLYITNPKSAGYFIAGNLVVDNSGQPITSDVLLAGDSSTNIAPTAWIKREIAAHSGGLTGATNGLSVSGSNAVLGGAQTGDITISNQTHDLYMGDDVGDGAYIETNNASTGRNILQVGFSADKTVISQSNGDIKFDLYKASNSRHKGIEIINNDLSGIIVTDNSKIGLFGAQRFNVTSGFQYLQKFAVDSTAIAKADSIKGTISSVSLANPSGLLTFTASNGSAVTALRSDGLHKIDSTVVASVANHPTLAQLQTALNLKANLASPTFTGTVTIPNGGVFGTPTSMTATNVTGLPLTTGVTGLLPNANTTATAANTASAIVARDANNNAAINNLTEGYTTTATAAGTTTLTVSSAPLQYFTGSTTQTVVLPVTSTLVLGQQFTIVNNSTGIVTVQSSGGNVIFAQKGSTTLVYTVILTSGTTAASWSATYELGATASTGNITLNPGLVSGTYGLIGLTLDGSGGFRSRTFNSLDFFGNSVNVFSISAGSTSYFAFKSNSILGFSSSDPTAAGVDVAFTRNAAGIMEVNNGTAGTFADLKTANLTIALGKELKVAEGTNGFTGQTTLVAGTKAITITGVTTSSRAFCQLVSQGGTVTTTQVYAAVCTANTLTITALTNAGSTDTTDTSVLNYFIVN